MFADSLIRAGPLPGTELSSYTFASPDTYGEPGGNLGNDIESIIGPGDSGGPVLVVLEEGCRFVGVSTFTEGFGGRFGDIGGECGAVGAGTSLKVPCATKKHAG